MLARQAAEGNMDPVIGRNKEVARVMQILARRQKNNPILLGEPGVGKTAIAEGLARSIVNETCPEFLKDKRILSLDVGLLMAGAKVRKKRNFFSPHLGDAICLVGLLSEAYRHTKQLFLSTQSRDRESLHFWARRMEIVMAHGGFLG
jgi:DNA polymerase III delta prime subunit